MIPWVLGGHRREQRMMGRRENGQGQFFYSFDLDEVVHLIIRFAGSELGAQGVGTLLLAHGPTFD